MWSRYIPFIFYLLCLYYNILLQTLTPVDFYDVTLFNRRICLMRNFHVVRDNVRSNNKIPRTFNKDIKCALVLHRLFWDKTALFHLYMMEWKKVATTDTAKERGTRNREKLHDHSNRIQKPLSTSLRFYIGRLVSACHCHFRNIFFISPILPSLALCMPSVNV